MADETVKEIEDLLAAEVEKERAANQRSLKVGGGIVGIVALYLIFVSVQISRLLDPTGLAEAASGAAIGAVPEGSKALRALVVDGAPELAKAGSDQIVELIPQYRLSLQAEFDPVIDESSRVLAEAAVAELAKSAGDPNAAYADAAALQAAADAAVSRVDGLLAGAMDAPDEEGNTPRQRLEASLTQLKKVDKELKAIARNQGDPQEREMLLAWLQVVGQHREDTEAALVAEHHSDTKAEAANKPPAPRAEASKPAGDAAKTAADAAAPPAPPAPH